MEKAEMKELLVQAWKEVFEVEEVPEDADFFEEGGDSIKAVQLSSWLLQKGIKLDLGKIFYTPTLSQMAEALEETDPVYVPEQMVNKELVGEKLAAVMQNQGAPGGEPLDWMAGNAAPGSAQICDPNPMAGGSSGQICDPNPMAGGSSGQICDPNPMAGAPIVPGNVPSLMSFGRYAEFNMMMSMFQTILSQQQVMLQMLQLSISRMVAFPVVPPLNIPMGQVPSAWNLANRLSPAAMAQFQQEMAKYSSHKVDKPIDEPNVMGIQPAKVTKPTHSAEEVLDHVLSGLLPKGYSKTEDLFAQGLTSLDTVKMVTRCGEHGYALSMQDIYMNSTFGELVRRMKPGA